jgi:RNA polymerase sigma-70 factor (ECF subfamily)
MPLPAVVAPKIFQRNFPFAGSNGAKTDRMDVSDEALVRQSRGGDLAAFETLVRRYQHMIHGLTFRMSGSVQDAEDLAQETFVRAFHQIGEFRGDSKFSTWLCRIAINACLHWREREVRRLRAHQAWAGDRALHAVGPLPSEGAEDSAGRVRAALQRLPAKQRAAIVLTVFEGLNHAEAARVLGCSETTVSWRVFAARRKLKRWLAKPDLCP